MDIDHIFSYLVPPGKGEKDLEPLRGTEIPLSGQLFEMLKDIYDKAEHDCNISIMFKSEDGTQSNEARGLILDFVSSPSGLTSEPIARRLCSYTTGRSKLGLLFLVHGCDGEKHKVMFSRFPADQGVLADIDQDSLSVQFVERVFMKNSKHYKSAVYQGLAILGSFWTGKAQDRQQSGIADYWSQEFLSSVRQTTSVDGTIILTDALREATALAKDPDIQDQLVSMALLLPSLKGKTISIRGVLEQYGIEEETSDLVISCLESSDIADEYFEVDEETLEKYLPYVRVILDNGAYLSATSQDFNEAFKKEIVNLQEGLVQYTTTGHIVRQRLVKRL